jgi:ATP-dependent RNA helicase DeaD
LAFGKKAGYHNKAIVDYIVEETGIPSREIDDVKVMEDFSFITVPEAQAETVLRTFKSQASRAKEDRGAGRSSGGSRGGDRGGRSSSSSFSRNAGSSDRPRSFGGPRNQDAPKTGFVKKPNQNRFRDREAR